MSSSSSSNPHLAGVLGRHRHQYAHAAPKGVPYQFSWESTQSAITMETKEKETDKPKEANRRKSTSSSPSPSPTSLPPLPSPPPVDIGVQTAPFSPDFVVDRNDPYSRQLVALSNLTFTKGLPVSAEDVKEIDSLWAKSRAESALPPLSDVGRGEERRKKMEEMEMKEWEKRKKAMLEEQKEKADIFRRLLAEREEKAALIESHRLLNVLNESQKSFDKYRSKLNEERLKGFRLVEMGRRKKMAIIDHLTRDNRNAVGGKRDIIGEYTQFDSNVYINNKRDGKKKGKNEMVAYEIPLLHGNYEGIKFVEERITQKLPVKLNNFMLTDESNGGALTLSTPSTIPSLSSTLPTSFSPSSPPSSSFPLLPPSKFSASPSSKTLRSSKHVLDDLFVAADAIQQRKNQSGKKRLFGENLYKKFKPVERARTPDWLEQMQEEEGQRRQQEENGDLEEPSAPSVFSTYISSNSPVVQSLLLLQSYLRGRRVQMVAEREKQHLYQIIEELKSGENYKIRVMQVDEEGEGERPFYHDFDNLIIEKTDKATPSEPIPFPSSSSSPALPCPSPSISSTLSHMFSSFTTFLTHERDHLSGLHTINALNYEANETRRRREAEEWGRRHREEEEEIVRMKLFEERNEAYRSHSKVLVEMMMAKAMDTYTKAEARDRLIDEQLRASKPNALPDILNSMDSIVTTMIRDVIFPTVEFRVETENKMEREERAREHSSWAIWDIIAEEVEKRGGKEQQGESLDGEAKLIFGL